MRLAELELLDFLVGEVHGVVGENGAGKSTLMKVLSGVYRAGAGRVIVRGSEVSMRHPGDAQGLVETVYGRGYRVVAGPQ